MYLLVDKEEGGVSYFVKIAGSILLYLLLGLVGPCSFVIVGVVCLSAEVCGPSQFPYWFIGFGALVILLATFVFVTFLIIVTGDFIFIKRCKCGSQNSG